MPSTRPINFVSLFSFLDSFLLVFSLYLLFSFILFFCCCCCSDRFDDIGGEAGAEQLVCRAPVVRLGRAVERGDAGRVAGMHIGTHVQQVPQHAHARYPRRQVLQGKNIKREKKEKQVNGWPFFCSNMTETKRFFSFSIYCSRLFFDFSSLFSGLVLPLLEGVVYLRFFFFRSLPAPGRGFSVWLASSP